MGQLASPGLTRQLALLDLPAERRCASPDGADRVTELSRRGDGLGETVERAVDRPVGFGPPLPQPGLLAAVSTRGQLGLVVGIDRLRLALQSLRRAARVAELQALVEQSRVISRPGSRLQEASRLAVNSPGRIARESRPAPSLKSY